MFSQQKYLKYDLKNTISIPSLNKDFQSLYLKYKNKYIGLKNQFGGNIGHIEYSGKKEEFPLDFINRTIYDLKLFLNIENTKAQLVCPEGKIELTDDCIITGYHAKENIEFVNESATDVAPTNDKDFEDTFTAINKNMKTAEKFYDTIQENAKKVLEISKEKLQKIIEDYIKVKDEEWEKKYSNIITVDLSDAIKLVEGYIPNVGGRIPLDKFILKSKTISINPTKNNKFIIKGSLENWKINTEDNFTKEDIFYPRKDVIQLIHHIDPKYFDHQEYHYPSANHILFTAKTTGNFQIVCKWLQNKEDFTINVNISS